jgi:hypothetical protein
MYKKSVFGYVVKPPHIRFCLPVHIQIYNVYSQINKKSRECRTERWPIAKADSFRKPMG